MLPLSTREEQIYDIYREAILSNTPVPRMRDIAAQLQLSYTSVHTYTTRIIEKGYLVRKSQKVLELPATE